MTESITVVSGIPRSGTSMMMRLLEAAGMPILSDGRRGPDASNPRGYFELDAVKRTRDDARWLEAAPGCAVKVIHSLLDALPDEYAYRVILMKRPMDAVIASQNRMLERLGESVPGPGNERLAAILSAQLEASRRVLSERSAFEWIEIDYPELVREPLPQLAILANFLEIPLDSGALIECIEPELNHEKSLTAR